MLTNVATARKRASDSPYATFFMGAMFVLLLSGTVYVMADKALEERPICDRAFKDFMAAENLVDLERAKFILDKLDCSMARRLERRTGE
ncbi:hypothetical protein FM996_11845 [Methylosinus sporium]|uniref:Uncharacterized protein n=1 Tax=Methylosinus sporium TaxID=428 RepID=A0A549ST14_METSR|nr:MULTISPECIES: hypothetical protein [Methylosinus]TRL32761.1 hypothetical protein FM996_11845 [Methylosinus sporium]